MAPFMGRPPTHLGGPFTGKPPTHLANNNGIGAASVTPAGWGRSAITRSATSRSLRINPFGIAMLVGGSALLYYGVKSKSKPFLVAGAVTTALPFVLTSGT